MTVEEKAKAYDEALEQARKELKQDLHESGVWAIQRIFPRLKESEDERIRKELIELVNELISEPGRSGITVGKAEKYLAYLQRQKKQPQEELVYRMNGLMQEYVKSGKDEEEQEHRLKCYQLFWDALGDSGYFDEKPGDYLSPTGRVERLPDGGTVRHTIGYLEKKAVGLEMDEDIELGIDRALMIVKDAKGVLPGYQSDDGIYECDHAIETLENILKTIQ